MKHKTTNILRLTNTVRQNIKEKNLFHSWHNLLITFSGGQDSAFCLLVFYLLDSNRKQVFFCTLFKQSFNTKNKKKGQTIHNFVFIYSNFVLVLLIKERSKNIILKSKSQKLLKVTKQCLVKSLFLINNLTPHLYLNNYQNKRTSYLSVMLLVRCKQKPSLNQNRVERTVPKQSFGSTSFWYKPSLNQNLVIPKRSFGTVLCKNFVFAPTKFQPKRNFCSQCKQNGKIAFYLKCKPRTKNVVFGRANKALLFLLTFLPFTEQSFFKSKSDVYQKLRFWYELEKNQIINSYLTLLFFNNYTLLWCNHFWQKDSFFTMEHVSKLAFSKDYTTFFFAPVQKVFSEQNARHWRHKVMGRQLLFLYSEKRRYKLKENSNKPKQTKIYFANDFSKTKEKYKKTKQYKKIALQSRLIQKLRFSKISSSVVRTYVREQKRSFCLTKFLHKEKLTFRNREVSFNKFQILFAGTINMVSALSWLEQRLTPIWSSPKTHFQALFSHPPAHLFRGLNESQFQTNFAQLYRLRPERAHLSSKYLFDQFIDLFLSRIMVTTSLLYSVIELKEQNSALLEYTGQSCISNTTFELSELLCVQGHNKSDRAEAILFNLIRGAGINGISTLQWKQTLFFYNNQTSTNQERTKLRFLSAKLEKSSTERKQSFSKTPSSLTRFSYFNDNFYPIFLDFFKEVSTIYLDTFLCRKENLTKKEINSKKCSPKIFLLKKMNYNKRAFANRIKKKGRAYKT